MKRFIAYSFLIHVSILLLIAFARGSYKTVFPQERIIPINVISIPPPQKQERKTSVPEKKQSPPPPVATKREPSRKAQAEVPTEPLNQREIVSSDLVSKIKPLTLSENSLKDKIADRLKKLEPVSPERTAMKPDNDIQERVEPLDEKKPQAKSTDPESMPSPTLMLETENFAYAWYITIVKNKIYENWSPPKHMTVIRPGVGTMVKFKVQRNGKVSNVAIQRTSGYTLLDRSAREAVEGINNLPPLPADYREESVNVIVFFTPIMP